MAHTPDVPGEIGATRLGRRAGPGTVTGSVLVIDDDRDIQLVLQFALEEAGLTPVPALTGEQGLLIAADTRLDAALVDLRLPGLHGSELLPTLRARSPMPILVITAQTEGTATTDALGVGADDYLTKPFATRDVIHRIATQLDPHPPPSSTAGRLSVGPPDGAIHLDGRPLPLTRVEQRLLGALIATGGQPLGPNELLRRVWGYTTPGDHAVVSSMVTRIQRRLEQAGGADLLVLEHAGYRLALPAR